jgi:PrtD family type I secretion system ABC transporter
MIRRPARDLSVQTTSVVDSIKSQLTAWYVDVTVSLLRWGTDLNWVGMTRRFGINPEHPQDVVTLAIVYLTRTLICLLINVRVKLLKSSQQSASSVQAVLASCWSAAVSLFMVSGIINVLMLTGSLFMMQVYDLVLGSHSVPTLVLLSVMATAAYLFQGGLDVVRTRVLGLIGERIEGEVAPKVYDAVIDLPLRMMRGENEAMQPFRDIDAIRGFVTGPGPVAMFDIPWMPVYLIFLFLLHWSLSLATVVGALILIFLTWLTDTNSKDPTKATLEAQSIRNQTADASQRGAEVVRAMGLRPVMSARWLAKHEQYMTMQRRVTFVTTGIAGASKVVRMILQSAMLGLGAFLAIKGEISSGSIIAGTILSGRALAPIDQAIGAWKGFISARQAHDRLAKLLGLYPDKPKVFTLPAPTRTIYVENLIGGAPGSRVSIVKRANFEVRAGQALGVIGPSASGKTTLIRALIGVWGPLGGRVLLDGAAIDQWDLRETETKIGELTERRVSVEDQLTRIDIRAPISGTVHQLNVHTIGGVINQTEPLMLIVPEADRLIVEVRINQQDIDQVRSGQSTRVRVSAFNQRTTPEVNGRLLRIDGDITKELQTGQMYYTAAVRAVQRRRDGQAEWPAPEPRHARRSLHHHRPAHARQPPDQAARRPDATRTT